MAGGRSPADLGGNRIDWATSRFSNCGKGYVGLVGLAWSARPCWPSTGPRSGLVARLALDRRGFIQRSRPWAGLGPLCRHRRTLRRHNCRAAMNMISALAGGLGAVMVGYLFDRGRPDLYVFIIFAAVLSLAAICLARCRRHPGTVDLTRLSSMTWNPGAKYRCHNSKSPLVANDLPPTPDGLANKLKRADLELVEQGRRPTRSLGNRGRCRRGLGHAFSW